MTSDWPDIAWVIDPEKFESKTGNTAFDERPTQGRTLLTVLETGFDRTTDPASNMTDHARGWTILMDVLADLHTAAV